MRALLRRRAARRGELEDHHDEQREHAHRGDPVAAAPLDAQILAENRQEDVHAVSVERW